jgi:4-amino-4-deoxy-L-arabinose transferase-like glycosyltransferase
MMSFFRNEKNMQLVVATAFTLLALFHLITLSISPIVWTDEVCLNSITVDWLQNRTLHFTADKSWIGGREALFYGPVFFMLNGGMIAMLGNDVFSGRLVGLLSGLSLCVLCLRLLRTEAGARHYVLAIGVALMLSDVFFGAALHRARMDPLALLFYFGCAALLFRLLRDPARSRKTVWWVVAGVLAGLALLTTSRMILFTPALALLAIWYAVREKFSRLAIINLVVAGAVAALLVLSWFVYAFKSYAVFEEHYRVLKTAMLYNESTRFTVRRELYVTFGIALAAFVLGLVVLKRAYLTPLVLFCVINVFCYYAFVDDTGPYSILVLPYLYLLFLTTFQLLSERSGHGKWILVLGAFLVFYNLSLFGFRTALLVLDWPSRDHRKVEAFVNRNVPQNARVAGDYIFYYAVVNNGNPYQMLFSYQTGEDINRVEKFCRDTFNYDYMLMAERTPVGNPKVANLFLKGDSMVPVAAYTTEHSALLWKLNEMGLYEVRRGTYDGTLYRRVRGSGPR